ncbi:hypothetical protein [Hyphomicrobium sp. NDB2Meth4]|uniref:hypothetical protein n=1 Tax=Hyphomicrobium sp. NDB2Meth4 TaxID=1892846 RepID=UPI000930FEE7|nr:hypothetical protein [Hyphomicrobium sp. NDB2Meth4]
MPLPKSERAKIEAVPLCGPRTADFLELIGVESFDALADADAGALRLAVNAALGRPLINAMGERAFQNAIEAARSSRRRRGSQRF